MMKCWAKRVFIVRSIPRVAFSSNDLLLVVPCKTLGRHRLRFGRYKAKEQSKDIIFSSQKSAANQVNTSLPCDPRPHKMLSFVTEDSWLRTVCVCRFPGLLAKGPRDECGTLLTLLALTEWYFSLCPTMPDTIDVIDYPEALLEIGGCHCRLWLEWTR